MAFWWSFIFLGALVLAETFFFTQCLALSVWSDLIQSFFLNMFFSLFSFYLNNLIAKLIFLYNIYI